MDVNTFVHMVSLPRLELFYPDYLKGLHIRRFICQSFFCTICQICWLIICEFGKIHTLSKNGFTEIKTTSIDNEFISEESEMIALNWLRQSSLLGALLYASPTILTGILSNIESLVILSTIFAYKALD